MRPGTAADHAQRIADAYEAVRDQWIADQRYEELVKAIIANWTSGNCVEYMAPLSEALVAAGRTELHRHLWTRVVKRQVATMFRVLDSIDGLCPVYLRLMNLDTAGFVETDPAAYLKPERAAAFLLQRLSADLRRWRHELVSGQLATTDPDQIERSLRRLEIPQIKVNKLPPGNASSPTPTGDAA